MEQPNLQVGRKFFFTKSTGIKREIEGLRTLPQRSASATLCPTLEGYPDCPWSDNAARAFNQGNLEAAKAAVPAKSHHRY
jgi:hypothetical protein